MKTGDVVALVTLPEVLPGRVPGEVLNLGEEMVVLARVTSIGFPVPDVVELWVRLAEPLDGHELVPVHLPVSNLGIGSLANVLIPKDRDATEFGGNDLLEHVIVSLRVVEDGNGAVLDVHEEEHLEFTAGEEGSLLDHGTNGLEIIVGVGVTFPSPNQDGSARMVLLCHLSFRHLTSSEFGAVRRVAQRVNVHFRDLKTRLQIGLLGASVRGVALVVALNALVLQLSPVDLAPDDLLFLNGLPVGQIVLVGAESISAIAAVAIKADVCIQAQTLNRAGRGLREVARDLWVSFDQIQVTLVERLATWALARHIFAIPLLLPIGAVILRVRKVGLRLCGLLERLDTLCIVTTLTCCLLLSWIHPRSERSTYAGKASHLLGS